ncbi:hypothetical protein [Sunxiuqinia indica]|uniref:hypothetical protein n=1 Tax=Sunxiuqinia indica TaxID=2692584 RepID=UPI00135929B8|nr:hypothetical protein [Sunxiuqinia indica]
MKKILSILMLTLSIACFSQSYDFRVPANENVYAEFYSLSTNQTFTTDLFDLYMFDNVTETSQGDTVPSFSTGFQAKLHLISYKNSLVNITGIDSSIIALNDTGIVRLKFWDTKLYGYCQVNELNQFAGNITINIVGIKNVPQRKKLLFKDSSRLRMWNNPWIGN